MADDNWKPNLFVPGFSKCGTTALCEYLAQHSDVYLIEGKEPRTLSRGEKIPQWYPWHVKEIGGDICMDFEVYKDLFSKNKDLKYRVDGSWAYSMSSSFAARIQKFAPNAKIIMMIRSQKERMVSTYFFTYVDHLEHDLRRYIEKYFIPEMKSFLFYDIVKSYYNHFGNNVLVLQNDSLRKYPSANMTSVFRFLDLQDMAVKPKLSNVGRFASLENESDRRSFSYSYGLAYLAGAPARTILSKTGKYGNHLKSKLARISPTLTTERKFAEVSTNKNNSKRDYSKLISQIPEGIIQVLDEDYQNTVSFCKDKGIVVLS